MPLSEHEQRVLEQIERSLYAEDPKFAATVRGIDLRTHFRHRILRGLAGVVVGIALLPVGIAVHLIAISIGGFVVMLLSALYAVSSSKRLRDFHTSGVVPARGRFGRRAKTLKRPKRVTGAKGPKPAGPRRTITGRLEDRWRRRFDGHGFDDD